MRKNLTLLKQLDIFSFGDDISRIRYDLLDNIDAFRNKRFAFEFAENFLVYLDLQVPDSVYKKVLKDFRNSENYHHENFSNETWNENIDSIKNSLSIKIYSVNFWLISLFEILYSVSNNTRTSKFFINKLIVRIISNDFIQKRNFDSTFKDETAKSKNFDLYFAYALRQLPLSEVNNFLKHHYKKFAGDYFIFWRSY